MASKKRPSSRPRAEPSPPLPAAERGGSDEAKATPSTSKKKKAAQRPAARVVAVTGAFGNLGRRLLQRLEADDTVDRIVALDVKSGAALLDDDDSPGDVLKDHPKLSAHHLDLTDPGAERDLAQVLSNEGVQGLFHLAFLSTPTHAMEMAHELETVGTHYVLNAAKSAGVARVVSLSSTMCYGARPDNPAFLTEDHPLRPPPSRSLRDKADADEQVRKFAVDCPDVDVAVARVGALLPTARDHFWTRFFQRPAVPAVLGYDPLLQFVHPDDAALALHLLWAQRARGVYNVVSASQLPFSHILTHLKKVPIYLPAKLGQSLVRALWSAQLVEMPQHFWGFLRWPWLCDGTKIQSQVGFTPQHDLLSILNILSSQKAPKQGGPA
jgi:UDP-glucose 4-epimerase